MHHPSLFASSESAPALRPYQADVLERASAATTEHASILIVQPTGTGKTRVAVEACFRHHALGGVPMFVAPRRELVSQARAALAARGLRPELDVFVRTIQELTMPGAVVPPATMVVLDEARHYVADEWSTLKAALPGAIYLGLDATPERADGRGLSPFFTILLEAISIRDAVEGGYLVPCETIRPDHSLGTDRAQSPADAWFKYCAGLGLSTVIFVRSVEEARALAAEIESRGGEAEAVWGEMPSVERDRALKRFASGDLGVLVNVQLLTEGWDAPRTECVMLTAPCSTAGGLLQRVGRGLRPFPGKERCVLIDLCGTSHDLGDPDEPRTWHLEGKAARRALEGANVRFCPVCGAPTEAPACAQCGYSGEMKKRKPRVLGLPMDRFARERAKPEEQQLRALGGLLRAARARGFKDGWAMKVWSAKYGRRATAEMVRQARRLA